MQTYNFEYDVSQFDLNLNTNTLVAEASELELSPGFFPQWIHITFPNKGSVKFIRGYADYDASGEDIAGFNYRSSDADCDYRLLIIND
jgi:hypothetical protein